MKRASLAAKRMNKQPWVALSLALVLVVFSPTGGATSEIAASQNLIVNGDFETGTLENWEFSPTTEGSALNEKMELFRLHPSQDNSTYCFDFTVRRPPTAEGWQGGELSQTFTAPAGTWDVSVYIAGSIRIEGFPPVAIRNKPKFELFIDGTLVDSFVFEEIYVNQYPSYGKLYATGSFESEGTHEIKLRITSDWTGPIEVLIDNVRFRMVPLLDGEALEEYGGHYYRVVPVVGGLTWDEANAAANEEVSIYGEYHRGHLAAISSAEENAFVYNLMREKLGYHARGWIGGQQLPDQADVSDGWQWVTGETMSYNDWDPATGDSPIPSPNDAGGPDSGSPIGRPWGPENNYGYPYFGLEDNGENCMEMRGYGYWDDLNCATKNSSYVIEFEPIVADLITDGGDNPTDIGDLHVRYMNEQFNIEFNVEAPWEIVETHVYIDEVPPDKSSPGRFPYIAGAIPFATSEVSVYIAAHAEVRMQTGMDENLNPIWVYESVWAQDGETDLPIGKGENWATYFEYLLPIE